MTASPPVQLTQAAYAWPGGRGLEPLSFTVEAGEIVTLLGPNGAGKSTLLKLLSGEIVPQQGEVQIFGEAHHPSNAAVRRRIGLVLQEPSSDDLMTVQETLTLHGRLFGLHGKLLNERSTDLLGMLHLSERARDRCAALSGGLRRRLDLARALLHDPALLLLDEPTLALDPDSSRTIWAALHERAEQGAAVVVCSNDTNEAEAHADRVLILNRGRLAAEGAPAALTANLRRDAIEVLWEPDTEPPVAELAAWDGVGSVRLSQVSGSQLHLTVDRAAAVTPRLFQQYGEQIRSLRQQESSLRDAWFQIIGTSFPDGDALEQRTEDDA